MVSQPLTRERVKILEPNANLDLIQGPSPNVVLGYQCSTPCWHYECPGQRTGAHY